MNFFYFTPVPPFSYSVNYFPLHAFGKIEGFWYYPMVWGGGGEVPNKMKGVKDEEKVRTMEESKDNGREDNDNGRKGEDNGRKS